MCKPPTATHNPGFCHLLLALLFSAALPAEAQQDSAFLSCARFADRGQRIACLEDALEAAVGPEAIGSSAAAMPESPSTGPAESPAAGMPTQASVPAEVTGGAQETSLLERIRNFGQERSQVDLSVDESGQERLHDSIASLEKRNNLWIVTLSSGQVWRQTYPRNLMLREGDAIEIYREGIGNAFRLATPRLSGFIRVERVR